MNIRLVEANRGIVDHLIIIAEDIDKKLLFRRDLYGGDWKTPISNDKIAKGILWGLERVRHGQGT